MGKERRGDGRSGERKGFKRVRELCMQRSIIQYMQRNAPAQSLTVWYKLILKGGKNPEYVWTFVIQDLCPHIDCFVCTSKYWSMSSCASMRGNGAYFVSFCPPSSLLCHPS